MVQYLQVSNLLFTLQLKVVKLRVPIDFKLSMLSNHNPVYPTNVNV
ncbi:hypothetical protein AOR13_3010 [Alteromonas stellipolaris LMG 21856]|nr:hypothetical protein AOR13_3010 [Alteromonas stellipolaris LMG 21856]